MEILQEYEDDLYIAEFSRNISLPNDTDDDNVDSDNNIKEIEEDEENIRGRDTGRTRGRPRGSNRGRGHGHNNYK